LGEYSRSGLELVLMRCGFDIEHVVEITNAQAGPDFTRPEPSRTANPQRNTYPGSAKHQLGKHPASANPQRNTHPGSAKHQLGISGEPSRDSDCPPSAIEGWVVRARARPETPPGP
jgi:hypothetical protein